MQQFEGNIADFNPNNPYAGDEKTPIKFYMGVSPDSDATEREGRPIFRDEEYIQIFTSKDSIVDRPVRDTDKQRWPRQYQGWKLTNVSEPGMAGTPLEVWPQMSRAQVEEFKYFKVYTVEQLAEMPDQQAQKIMGVQRLKLLAKAYVETARGEAPMLKMQKELETRDEAIAELKSAVADLSEQLKKYTKKAA